MSLFGHLWQNNDINLGFETFLCFSNRKLDKHVPINTEKKREKTMISKPWITGDIKISLKKMDKHKIIHEIDIMKHMKNVIYMKLYLPENPKRQ